MADKTLKTRIQLLRNTNSYFSTNNPLTLNGEIYIVEDNEKLRFKVGEVNKNYNDLPFYDESLLELLGFDISEVQDKQILMYNSTSQKWENVNLTDDNSIIYIDGDNGLSIKGYDSAKQGQMLVKDAINGLSWVDPLDETKLHQAVANAEHSASEAANQAVIAGNKAIEADTSAKQAERINQKTMEYVNEKFAWMTIDEYNQLEEINEGTFYFIQM